MLKKLCGVALIAILSTAAFADDCSKLAGTWSQKESEVQETPTIIKIEASCKVELLQEAAKHDKEALTIDSLFYAGDKLRAQYGIKPGSLDESGNPIPLPLSDEMKKSLQGNVYVNQDGTISFGIDSLDQLCGGPEKCPGAKFYKQN